MMQIGVSPKIEYLRVLHVLFECVIDVQQREVVTIDVGKSGLESGVRKRTQHPGLTTTASMVQKALYFGEGKKNKFGGQKSKIGGPNRPQFEYQH